MSSRRLNSEVMVDDEGREYVVDVYPAMIITGDLDGSRDLLHGLPTFRLPNGDAVNKLKDGNFQVVHSGQILRPKQASA